MEVKRGEVYLAVSDMPKGSVQRRKFPVLILQNDLGNKHNPTTIIAPITSKIQKKKKLPVHVIIHSDKMNKEAMVMLEQIHVIDKSCLRDRLCKLNDKEMSEINVALKVCFQIGERGQNKNRV